MNNPTCVLYLKIALKKIYLHIPVLRDLWKTWTLDLWINSFFAFLMFTVTQYFLRFSFRPCTKRSCWVWGMIVNHGKWQFILITGLEKRVMPRKLWKIINFRKFSFQIKHRWGYSLSPWETFNTNKRKSKLSIC